MIYGEPFRLLDDLAGPLQPGSRYAERNLACFNELG
jgi:hypothetical protein